VAERRAKVQSRPKRAAGSTPLLLGEGHKAVDLSMLDNLVGYNLRRALGVQMQRFSAVFGPLNIRPVQFSILALIHHNPEIRQSALGKALHIERANMVTLLAELEGRGLVTRRTAAADRRSRVLQLTAAGRKLTQELLDLHARLERDVEAQLGSKERDELVRLLATFRRLDPAPDIGG
jgi:DNA-binding MarR family transcriptional regulator